GSPKQAPATSPAPTAEPAHAANGDAARERPVRAGNAATPGAGARTWRAIAWTSAAVGAAGTAVAGRTRIHPPPPPSELRGACADSGACPKTEADRIQSYDALRTAALVGGIVGGAGGVACAFSFWRSTSGEMGKQSEPRGGAKAGVVFAVRGRF